MLAPHAPYLLQVLTDGTHPSCYVISAMLAPYAAYPLPVRTDGIHPSCYVISPIASFSMCNHLHADLCSSFTTGLSVNYITRPYRPIYSMEMNISLPYNRICAPARLCGQRSKYGIERSCTWSVSVRLNVACAFQILNKLLQKNESCRNGKDKMKKLYILFH